eukprot:FR739747.1.p1 GENE.FR739747.1~~FR739747.1.p1  ORF type:complete len:120 (-),score=34.00 FR739747.1:610-969(-)
MAGGPGRGFPGGERGAGRAHQIYFGVCSLSFGPPRLFHFLVPGFLFGGELGADNNFTQETGLAMFTPSAQLTLPKGNKSWSSTAVAAALELVDPLGFGPWLSLKRCEECGTCGRGGGGR